MLSLPYYTSTEIQDVDEVIRETGTAVGFEVERAPPEEVSADAHTSECIVSYDEWDFNITFDIQPDDNRANPDTPRSKNSQVPLPRLTIRDASWFSDPGINGISQEEYQRRVDITFEFICRFAMATDVEYAPMLGFADPNPLQCWPTDYPITDHIEELPIFGIYSESALEDLGGLDAMFDRSPWYIAELPSGHTIIIQEDFPWNKRDWSPPTDAEFLETVTLPDSGEYVAHDFADPFASLESGAVGTDLCVPREKIGPEFRNEDLELVRVRVDEQRDLRRLDDGSFVRNVVDDDPGDPAAFMQAMLEEIPADATADDLMVSALLKDAIPPAFVRLEGPDDETVVSTIAGLDIDSPKVDLLISLGRVAQDKGVTDETLREINAFLENLSGLENIVGLEERIRDRLL